MRIGRYCALLLLLLAAPPLSAESPSNRVDGYVRRRLEAHHVAGLSVAVVRNGKTVLAKGYGMADLEWKLPARADTVYQLASVTKQFTATAVMMLVEEGKVRLTDPITSRLEDLPAAWSGVTVKHLLNHTSGIKSYTSVPGLMTSRKDYAKGELIGLVRDAPLEFQPGERWAYNNSGYYLLGMLIEKLSGKEYGQFLKERIFEPLGMMATRVNDLGAIIPNRARGYTWRAGSYRNGDYVPPSQPFSAGALVSTVEDMAKWDAALYGERLLKRASLEQMWTPTILTGGRTQDYGFGWAVGAYRTRKRISHGGGIPGFSTNISRFVDDGLTVIVLANTDTAQADTLAADIAAFYIPALERNAPKPIADSDTVGTARLRAVFEGILAGKPDRSAFTADAQSQLFPDRIREAREFLSDHGKLARFELMKEQSEGARRTREYRATFSGFAVRIGFVLAPDGAILALGIRPD